MVEIGFTVNEDYTNCVYLHYSVVTNTCRYTAVFPSAYHIEKMRIRIRLSMQEDNLLYKDVFAQNMSFLGHCGGYFAQHNSPEDGTDGRRHGDRGLG